MINRAPTLTAACAALGAIAMVTAGPAVAHRIISKHQVQLTHPVMGNSIADDDYVKLLVLVSQPGS
jgi:Na+/glutamate symporter